MVFLCVELFVRWGGERALEKAIEVAKKYGLKRNYSTGGKNGVFFQRPGPHDERMRATTRSYLMTNAGEVTRHLGCRPADFGKLREVKIVSHGPQGRRFVGVFNPANHRIVLLGTAEY
jgi:hypothetical protein